MKLHKDRDTKRRDGRDFSFPVAAATVIYAGSIVYLTYTSGLAVPASTPMSGGPGKFPCLATETVDNREGQDGDKLVAVERTVVGLDYDNTISRENIGNMVYLLDDCTVTSQGNGGARLRAGLLVDLNDGQAWVDLTRHWA